MKRLIFVAALLLSAAAMLGGCTLNGNGPTDLQTYGEHADLGHGITKKGVCVSRYDDGSDMGAANLNSLGVSWYYNWGADMPTEKIDAEYVPMIWGAGSVNAGTLSRISEGVKNGTYEHLLTFNEPDANTPGISSGVSVETALDLWPQLEALNVPLSSPAPTYYADGGWLDDFMEGAKERGYRVDFIALHCYQNFADPASVDALKAQLTEVYAKYGLPIWITEFAAIDIWAWGGGKNPACTQEAALTYTKNVTDMLENLGFVERYAWFIDNTGSPSESPAEEAKYTYLFDPDDSISATGEVYKNQVSRLPLFLYEPFLPEAQVGREYFFTVTAEGGKGNYTFSAEGAPSWLTVGKGGQLYGTPTEYGSYTFRIFATDEDKQRTFREYTLTVIS